MTVADNTSRNQYTATSGQTVFAYTFEIVDKGDIVVLKNGTTLSEGADYSVSNVGNENGGNVTLTVGATTGDILTLYRDMPYARTQNYTNSGDFLASEVNSDLDNLWLAGEQTNRAFSQSIRKPITDSDSISMELPEAASRANKYLSFTATGAVSVADGTGAYTNADVDAHLNTSTALTNQTLSWNGSDYAWVTSSGGGFNPDVDAFNIGNGASSTGLNAIALGHDAQASAQDTVATGHGATASAIGSASYGRLATASNFYDLALGHTAIATGVNSIAIGRDSDVNTGGSGAVALGYRANIAVNASYGVAIGNLANVDAQEGVAIGSQSNANQRGTAVGFRAGADAPYSMHISSKGSTANQPQTQGHMVIETDSAKIEYNGNWDLSTGDLTVNGGVEIGTNWKVRDNGSGVLIFSTGGVDKMKLDASGNLTVVGNVTAYGTI